MTLQIHLANSEMEIAEIILKYTEVLIWPSVTIFTLIYFRNELSKLFDRAKKVELPGGFSIETFDEKLEEAKQLEKEIISERKPEIEDSIKKELKNKPEINKKMLGLGLRPSPSGLDLNYYREIAKTDTNLALAGLRMDLELMLKNLATGFNLKTEANEPIQKTIHKLSTSNSITLKQADFIRIIFELTNYAVHGGTVSKEQFDSVLELGYTLVEDYLAWLDWGFKKQL